jgi:hypothetical protein
VVGAALVNSEVNGSAAEGSSYHGEGRSAKRFGVYRD